MISAGNCSYYTQNSTCLDAKQGTKCVWVEGLGCMTYAEAQTKQDPKGIEQGICLLDEGNWTH